MSAQSRRGEGDGAQDEGEARLRLAHRLAQRDERGGRAQPLEGAEREGGLQDAGGPGRAHEEQGREARPSTPNGTHACAR